tara:strand:- start:262687 stop:263787 length:1101 start_codon:yes stop_codon:yes gene_type:complete
MRHAMFMIFNQSSGWLLGLLLLCGPFLTTQAHHSRAPFLIDETFTVTGTVKQVRWRSPHVFWAVDVVNDDGQIETWTFEGHSIAGLMNNGWQQDSVKEGDIVQVVANPNRDASRKFGLLDYFQHEDGRVFYSFRAPEGVEVMPATNLIGDGEIVPSSDFSGTWTGLSDLSPEERLRRALIGPGFSGPTGLPLTAKGEEQLVEFDLNNDPFLQCLPLSVPRRITWPYATYISRTENMLQFETELLPEIRTVYFDQAGPPADYVADELGFARAEFMDEGRTLLITSTDFAATPWGITRGLDSSTEKQTVEEYKLSDDGLVISYRITTTDPVFLTEPVVTEGRYQKVADKVFTREYCDLEASNLHLQFE